MTFAVGDEITNSAGNNQGKILAVIGEIFAVTWRARSTDEYYAVSWQTLEQAERNGWRRVGPQEENGICDSCGHYISHGFYSKSLE